MADNYIEKRMEELRSGSSSPANTVMNFDTVVARMADAAAVDPSYRLHSLQFQALTTALHRAGLDSVSAVLADNTVVLSADDAFLLGRATELLMLKAASMGLASEILHPTSSLSITLLIGKKA